MYREQRWEVKELNSVFVCKFIILCVVRRALECGSIIFRSIQDYSKSPFILTMDPRWPWHCPRSPARAKHSITQTKIRETGKHPNSRVKLKLKLESDPDQISGVCKTSIAYSIFSDMCCVLSRPVRCTCAQGVHIIMDERFQRTDDWGLNCRCLGPPEYARWGINYWLLNGFMDTHYTWKVCRIKVFMWRWVRFGGRHIETLFIDS